MAAVCSHTLFAASPLVRRAATSTLVRRADVRLFPASQLPGACERLGQSRLSSSSSSASRPTYSAGSDRRSSREDTAVYDAESGAWDDSANSKTVAAAPAGEAAERFPAEGGPASASMYQRQVESQLRKTVRQYMQQQRMQKDPYLLPLLEEAGEDGVFQRERKYQNSAPFSVYRTASDNLPVYVYKRKNRNEAVTVIRKVRGDEESFRKELEFLCRARVSFGKSGFLEVPGNHRRIICAYLRSIGY
eukprot:TRINITY_DN82417_c0_g1_i1.p1 TRINITY_DN82417_c0_g1~~TRINITY_DN82417_c0_g1_i1.p1  ORF type:complete len:247 (-),score=41.66 TRINITY_DN82417_c0_g1_i1:77-817(-)